jgi:PAS domain S-box-containing protein
MPEWIQIAMILLLCFLFFLLWRAIKGNHKLIDEKKAIQESINDALVITDSEYHIIHWNARAEMMFGFKADEAIGERLGLMLKTKSDDVSLEKIRTLIKDNKSWNGNLAYLHKNGSPIFANVTTSITTDENGEISSTVSIIRDFSLLKQMIAGLEDYNSDLKISLSNQQHEMESLFNRITNGFFALDLNMKIKFINPIAAEIHKIDRSTAIGKDFFELTEHDLYGTKFMASIKEVAVEKKNLHYTLFYEPTKRWFENWIYSDENGVSVYYRDVTTEKSALIKLEENLERLNLIVAGTNDAIWDWDMITNEVWGNEKYYELLGSKKVGEDNFTTFSNRVFDEDKNVVNSGFQNAIDNKISDLVYEYRYLTEQSEVLHLFGKTKIIYDEEGKAYRTVGSIQDISLQKKYQQQILQQNEISESLISSIPGLFYLLNADGKIIRSHNNQKFYTQYEEVELINANAIDFLNQKDHALFVQKFKEVLMYGAGQSEFELITKGGEIIPILFSGVRINYHNQPCVMGVGIDISDRVQYQKELRALTLHLEKIREEERTIIAREIHDELGQQLTGLRMDLSWIKMKTESLPIKNKIMDSIDLIDNTMKTVRRISTRLRPGILDDLGLIATLEWQMEEFQKRYDMPAHFETNVSRVDLDTEITTSVFRIFQESLTNIAKHSQANQISASITILENQLTLIITDNGIGFDSDMIKDKKTFGIIGMRERTLLMNGQLQIESQCDNGTVVKVIIPLNKS